MVNEVERVGEGGGGGMLISVVDTLTCNMDLIAEIDLRCVLPNVGLRSLRVPFGSWQIQGYGFPAS